MNKNSLLFFNPYIGDSILASIMARQFAKHFGKEVYVATMIQEFGDFTLKYIGAPTYSSNKVKELMNLAKNIDTPLHKEYILGHFKYTYKGHNYPTIDLINSLLDELSVNYNELYIMHYSYEFAMLGRLARKRGFKVHGYFLNDVNQLYQTHRHHEPIPVVIWDKEYIGDRLTRLITGRPLTLPTMLPHNFPDYKRDKITLFPTSRSISANAGNWHMDLDMMAYRGYRTEIVYHHSESLPDLGERPNTLCHSIGKLEDMLTHVLRSEFIICYDSASFHLAWLTETPAIVKLKGGFNREWIPSWVRQDWKYFFIPATPMYEEEYLTHLKTGLEQLKDVREYRI